MSDRPIAPISINFRQAFGFGDFVAAPAQPAQGVSADESIPDFVDELPDIILPEPATPPPPPPRAVPTQEPFRTYIDSYPDGTGKEIVRWDIPREPISINKPPNIQNTQRAVQEYFLRARRHRTRSSTFLERYYQFEVPPRVGKSITRRFYSLYKARLNCDKDGVRIPRMDGECQSVIYYNLLDGLIDFHKSKRGEPIEPRPPQLFTPVFNVETQSYHAPE
ncbi:unnamed protein product [Caenorhabditis sp. 36 PRJEB53466]|nr:unnamed protein product [Caenorhabditis sp. 36 PRJEB53466]